MSSTAGASTGWLPADPQDQRRWRVALGIALSLAVHLGLLSAWRGKLFHESRAEQVAPPRSIAVWLRPPAPPPDRQAAPAVRAARPAAAVQPRTPRRVIAVPRREPAPPGRHIVQEQDPAPAGAPTFDHDAALRMARQIAAEPDPSGAPRQPLQAESKLARAIGAAKRRDCKDGLPGGLLGPLIIMFDKKDSGCKW